MAPPPLVLYISEEGHSCLRKASHLLGLGEPRSIPVDASVQNGPLCLARASHKRSRRGMAAPFCVVASAGTVNTGAVDPLDDLADFCRRAGSLAACRWGVWRVRHPRPASLALFTRPRTRRFGGAWIRTSGWRRPSSAVARWCGREISYERPLAWCLPYLRTEPDKGFGGIALVFGVRLSADAALQCSQTAVGDPAGGSRPAWWRTSQRHNTLAQYLAL